MSIKRNSRTDKIIDNTGNALNEAKKYVRKKRYPYRLYIPENLDIDVILDGNKPNFKNHRDYFIYILHLIVSIPARLKDFDFERNKGFTPIDKRTLSRRVHDYRNYINFLVEKEIIEEGTSYMPGYYSRGLKYTSKYRNKVRGIYITKNTLIKSITENHRNRDIVAEEKLRFLKQWFNPRLTIDMNQAMFFLEADREISRKNLETKRAKSRRKKYNISVDEIVTLGFIIKQIVADRINEGKNYHLSVDNTSGRFHSPLTQLKKGLRQYVKYDGERLFSIDIVNSQPLLSLTLLDYDLFIRNRIYKILAYYNPYHKELMNMDKVPRFYNPTSTMLVNLIRKCKTRKDVQLFRQAVSEGKFYELFSELLINNKLLPREIQSSSEGVRDFAKEATFTAFFSKIQDAKWNKHIQAFKKCFPTVSRIFDLVKNGHDNHAALACLLQRFESNLVLHEACKEINTTYPHAPIFTIHDSIVTTEAYEKVVEDIFLKHLTFRLGVTPKLKVDPW